jgi:protein disulfide-isomerase A1
MVSWVKKQTGPAAKLLKTKEELDAFVKENKDTALVGYFKDEKDLEYLAFLEVLKKFKLFDEFPAAVILGQPELSSVVGGEPAVQLFRSFDKPVSIRGEELKTLKEFVTLNGFPLVEEITGATFQRFVDANLPVGVLFVDFDKKPEFDALLSVLKTSAESLKGKFSFAYTNGVTYKEQFQAMGGDASKLPGVAAMDIAKRLNFPYTGEIESKALVSWAEGILSGAVKPFLKSQPIPEKNDEPVYVLVGKSFSDIVNDSTKDVLVEFYAPWCGHCKSLEPIYNKLGELTKGAKNLIIAKVDATENDTPVQIEGFPTLLFFPSNNKDKPLTYDASRTLPSLVKYLKENAVASKEELSKVETPAEDTKQENSESVEEEVEDETKQDPAKHDEL